MNEAADRDAGQHGAQPDDIEEQRATVAAGVCSHMAFLTVSKGPHDSYPAELLAEVWPVQRQQGRVCALAEVRPPQPSPWPSVS